MFYVFSSSRTLIATRQNIEDALAIMKRNSTGARVENADGIVMGEKPAPNDYDRASRRLCVENDFRAVQNGMRLEAVAA